MKKILALFFALLLCCAGASAEYDRETVTTLPDFAAFSEDRFTLNEVNDYPEYSEYIFSGSRKDFDYVRDYLLGMTEEFGYELVDRVENLETLADEICYLNCPDPAYADQFAREIDKYFANVQMHAFYYPGAEDMDLVFRLGKGVSFSE